MAKLNDNLIRSMVWDLKAVVEVSYELSSWTGKIDCMSWRYPCRQAQSVDLLAIFKNLNVTAGEFYIYLLEFIYDRLLLVMNLLIKFLDNFPIMSVDFKQSRNVNRPQHLSLGGLLNMFWARLQSLLKSVHVSNNMVLETQRPTAAATADSDISSLQCTSTDSLPANLDISHTVVSRSCQTDVVSLLACENCHICDELVMKLVKAIENTALDANRTSAVAVQRERTAERIEHATRWTAMAGWTEAIVDDFRQLTDALRAAGEANDKLSRATRTRAKKYAEKCASYKQATRQLKEQLKATQDRVAGKEDEMAQANERILACRLQVLELQNTCKPLEDKIQLADVQLKASSALLAAEEDKVQELTSRLDAAQRDNATLRTEQDAQQAVRRAERREVNMSERKLQLAQALFQEQTAQAQAAHDKEVAQLRAEGAASRRDADVQCALRLRREAEARELHARLAALDKQVVDLVRCPEPGGTHSVRATLEGDPLRDMQSQLRANQLRIRTLQADNEKLVATLDKLQRFAASKQ